MRPHGGRPAIQTPMRSDRKALPLSLNCNVCAAPMTVRFAIISTQRGRGPRRLILQRMAFAPSRAGAGAKRRARWDGLSISASNSSDFGPAAPAESRIEPRGGALVKPSFHSSPSLSPYRPLSIDLTKPGPEIPANETVHQSMVLENSQLKLSSPLPLATSVGRLFRTGRSGANAAVSFLLNRDAPDPANDTANVSLITRARQSFERELRTGLRILLFATLLGGGWLALVPLAGAVVVPGNLVVQSNLKTIQHPTGGVVAEIKVTNGARVAAGDLLLRLDATQARASLQTVSKQLDELRARIARLTAERDGLSRPEFPSALTARSTEDNVRSVVASEISLFKARSDGRKSLEGAFGEQNRAARPGDFRTGVPGGFQGEAA